MKCVQISHAGLHTNSKQFKIRFTLKIQTYVKWMKIPKVMIKFF